MLRWCRKFVLLLLVAAGSAMADDTPPSVGTLVSLAVEREVSAHNDLATATLFVEDTDKDPRVLAERINRRIESGLKTAHAHPAVSIRSGNRQVTPIYDEKQRAIVGWRERAELLLESTDLAAMSRLVEALQGGWSLAGMVLQKPVTPSSLYDCLLQAQRGLAATDPATGAAPATLQLADGVRRRLDGARILLVEDHPLNQELACELLRRAGMSVVVAGNGQDALDRLADAGPPRLHGG
jgi:hypothetical protein